MLEWIGAVGKRAAAAIEKLDELPRTQGGDLDNQIQQALTLIEEPRHGGTPGSQINRL